MKNNYRYYYTYFIGFLIFLTTLNVYANVASWEIVPGISTLRFIATQNGSPVSGEFKQFTGNINFDPSQLDKSNVTIFVDINSVYAPYTELVNTLKTPDWFDAKKYPQAVFKETTFTKIDTTHYQAKGILTIRNISLPITVNFVQDEYTPSQAKIHGSTTLKRTAFGVGQGDWKSTSEIKDEVKIDFVLAVIKK